MRNSPKVHALAQALRQNRAQTEGRLDPPKHQAPKILLFLITTAFLITMAIVTLITIFTLISLITLTTILNFQPLNPKPSITINPFKPALICTSILFAVLSIPVSFPRVWVLLGFSVTEAASEPTKNYSFRCCSDCSSQKNENIFWGPL